MNKRPLGRTGLQIAPLVFGGNVFGWTVDQPTSFSLLDRFVDAGLNGIDTADMYSTWAPGNKGGESETIINGPRRDISAVVRRPVGTEERKDGDLTRCRTARGG